MSNGRFEKGHTPWNKDMHDFRPSVATEFKKGQYTMSGHPSWKGGLQRAGKECMWVNVSTGVRKARPRLVYEEHYGPIPKGFVIFHIDGDNKNDCLENLEAISRAELVKRNNGR